MPTHRASMGAPSSAAVVPTTAPVLDYLCLFTHDLKRKQKRWQDGKLKYHTFNKRVMVYDEKANFIGDMHWNEDYDFGEGEEFQLERGCVIVQVSDCVGSKDQDLSELIEKRYKDKEQRQARAAAAAAAVATPSRSRPQAATPARPLADVSTTPRANYIGRAVIPTESPFEQRQAQNLDTASENPRPAKRRRQDVSPPSKSGYAQNLFGATLSLSSWSASGQARRCQDNDPPAAAAPSAGRPRPTIASQAIPSLLQKTCRDRPLDEHSQPEATVDSTAARQPTNGRPVAAAPTSDARGAAPPSYQQQKQPARPKIQPGSARNAPDVPSKEAAPRRGGVTAGAEDGSSSDDVVETSTRPLRPSPNTRNSVSIPKGGSPSRKGETGPKTVPVPKPQTKLRVEMSTGKPTRGEQTDHKTLNTPDAVQDAMEERSRLISSTKPSRRRRLLMVSRPQTDKDKGVAAGGEVLVRKSTTATTTQPRPVIMVASEAKEPLQTDHDTRAHPPKRKSLPRASSNPFVDFDSSESDAPLPKRRSERQTSIHKNPPETEKPTETAADIALGDRSRPRRQSNELSDDMEQEFASAQTRRPRQRSKERVLSDQRGAQRAMDPKPAAAPSDAGHRFVAPGARLATLRRGVKSKEVLFWPSDEDSSEGEQDKPVEPRKGPPVADEMTVVKASAPEKESEPPAMALARTSIRQTRQLSKPAEPKNDSSTADANSAQKLVGSTSVPPPAPATAPCIADGPDAQASVSFHGEPAAQRQEGHSDRAAEPLQAPSPEAADGRDAPVAEKMVEAVPEETALPAGLPTVDSIKRPARAAAAPTAAAAMPKQPPQGPGQRPRLVNPATRGRKAALKTDAAGQLPQTVVPAALPTTATVNQLRTPAPGPVRKASSTSEKKSLPGFSRAGGGAWSKTAHDLLGMERPA